MQVPIGALFRSRGSWSIFTVKDGKAELRNIKLGKMNAETAQVIEGINQNDTVILYPNDVLEDGTLVEIRQ